MNNNKLTFKEIITNKQYRAILYLGVYFIIFLVLIIMVRVGSNGSSNVNNDQDDQTVVTKEMNSIKNKNFNFKYTLTVDDKEYVYIGKQYDNKMLFTLDKDTYFVKEGVYSKKKNEDYVLTEDPTKYFNFFDIELLENMINKSTLTEEKHLLNIKDFYELTDNKEETSSDANIIIDVIKSNGIIIKINMDLTGCVLLTEPNTKSVKLSLEYSDFGIIEDFDIK